MSSTSLMIYDRTFFEYQWTPVGRLMKRKKLILNTLNRVNAVNAYRTVNSFLFLYTDTPSTRDPWNEMF